MIYKKPPDKYKTLKCNLLQIIKNKDDISTIFDAVIRTHKIVTHTYQFLRLFILCNYKKNKEIIKITDDVIKMVFKTLIQKSAGPKPKGNNLKILNEFNDFFSKYERLYFTEKIDGKNLSQILNYMSVDILTNIENNIKLNFISYVKRFVNSSFRKINNDLLENAIKGTKSKLRKQLNKELFEIKEDLLNNTLLSNEKYHNWININRLKIFPFEINNSLIFDLNNEPQKYIKSMIYMCQELEKNGTKSFQFFPLRKNLIPAFIPIDSKTIVELLMNDNKKSYLDDIEGNKYLIWDKYFNINDKIFKQKKHVFDYRISTDCYSVSIQFLHNSFIETDKTKKANMKNKKTLIKEACKDMSIDEKEKYKNKLKEDEKKRQFEFKVLLKDEKDKQKKEFNKLTKEEKQKIKQQIQEEKLKNNKVEFPYLEELNENQLNELKNNNWICIDPGKSNLLYMKSKNGITYNYTNRNYVRNIKRIKYQKLLKNYKDKENILKLENYLSKYNSKSCNCKNFKKYIKKKNQLFEILLNKYSNNIFRKYKWYSYINKKREDDNLINNIKQKFGEDTIINFGDWSVGNHQMKGHLSTPNLGLKRKLVKHFKVYNLDEFRTSLLNHVTEEKNENIYLPDKKGVERKIHSILTYQTENKRMGCINRDENSVNNMIKLVNYYLEFRERPLRFRREYKLDAETKDINPINSQKQ